MVDFFVGLIVYLILTFALGHSISIHIIFLPIALILTLLSSLGFGILFASFSVKYRDLLQLIPLVVQYGFFVSPIVYTAKSLQISSWFNVYAFLNPLVGLVEYARTLLIPNYLLQSWDFVFLSVVCCFIVFFTGIFIFTKKESSFVDYL